MTDKKDLTSLNDLFPTTPEADASGSGSGLDLGSFEPLSPTSSEQEAPSSSFTFSPDPNAPDVTFDPIGSLPPIDPDIEKLAAQGGHVKSAEELLESSAPHDLFPTADELLNQPLSPQEAPLKRDVQEKPSLEKTPVGSAIRSALSPDPTLTASEQSPGMTSLKNYSERLAPSSSPVIAATPYSLLIEGFLRTHERETLLQILSRESLGIREVELEPQFQAGRILIPRISEYAGVLIVQALRNANVTMHLGPSERIYASKETHDDDSLIFAENPETELLLTEEGESPADRILLTAETELPDRKTQSSLDTLHASMNLKAAHVMHGQSPVFQDSLEKLKRQLKLQAHHRGADALVSFKYELHPLEGQTIFKLVVQANAVRLG